MGLLLLASLAACDRSAGTDSPVAEAAAAAAAPVAPAPTVPTTNAADAGLAIAVARETADRAVREQTLRVQQQLREQERVREAAVRALNSGNDRCIDGQKLRRVGNGWVQAGTC
jgi:hypothetical protein